MFLPRRLEHTNAVGTRIAAVTLGTKLVALVASSGDPAPYGAVNTGYPSTVWTGPLFSLRAALYEMLIVSLDR